MSATQKFYIERAASARRDADAAPLANVRDRHIRAALAWDVMADRLARIERMRAETDARKAAAALTIVDSEVADAEPVD